VIVPADATATRDLPGVLGRPAIDQGMLHSAVLAALNDRFADVMSTKDILALPINR
jgi:hypothetical protein